MAKLVCLLSGWLPCSVVFRGLVTNYVPDRVGQSAQSAACQHNAHLLAQQEEEQQQALGLVAALHLSPMGTF